MATLGLPRKACDDILAIFRRSPLGVEDSLLQELAANFALDSPADLDPVDYLELLDVPGIKITLRISIPNATEDALPFKNQLTELQTEAVDLSTVATALMVIKTGQRRQAMNIHNALMDLLRAELHDGAVFGAHLFEDQGLDNETNVLLVLSGVGTPREILDAHLREKQTRATLVTDTEMDTDYQEFAEMLRSK